MSNSNISKEKEINLDRQIEFLLQFLSHVEKKMQDKVSLGQVMELQEVLFDNEIQLEILVKERRVLTNERFR